ncbi:Ribosomal RNA small subunit methyltransferase NEP1 [Spatholobus suberectus]|nr:Ribosomal RNA small subunit methyltransferase NEP1 [Spatholobus suberectus]
MYHLLFECFCPRSLSGFKVLFPIGYLLFLKSCIVCCTQLREPDMLNPSANSKLKRKRAEKQSPNLTIGKDEEKDAKKEETASNDGFLSTPMAYSPQNKRSPATFILDNASLKKGLVRKKWKILNSDEDAQFLLKQKKNPNDYWPDIIHEALRCILDSPLNKAGMVGAIYVKIDQGGVFEVKPHVRIPRMCNRFCGVIMELLQKSSVWAKDTNEILLHVVEEPITLHLPVNSHIVGLSYTSEKLVDLEAYVSDWSNDLSPVFVVGTMVNGKVKGDYMHDYISVSEYPLAAKYCLGMICEALEQKWKIF